MCTIYIDKQYYKKEYTNVVELYLYCSMKKQISNKAKWLYLSLAGTETKSLTEAKQKQKEFENGFLWLPWKLPNVL